MSVSPTRTQSGTVTETPVPLPFYISVKVFSSSGEQVANLYSGGVSEMPGSPTLQGSLVQSGFQGAGLQFAGTLDHGLNTLVRTGMNDTGGTVSGGIYYFHVESTDQFGTTSSYNLGVNVIEPAGENQINIFNSAGELVYQESFLSLTSTATDLSIPDSAFAPAFDSNGNPLSKLNGQIRSSDNQVSSWSWDGKNMLGNVVKPGVYSVVLSSSVPGTAPKKIVRSVQVLAASDSYDARPLVAYPSAKSQFLEIHFLSGAVRGSVSAGLYNLAGELVGKASADAASGVMRIDVGRNASGIYVVIFEYATPAHLRKRSLLKAAVLK